MVKVNKFSTTRLLDGSRVRLYLNNVLAHTFADDTEVKPFIDYCVQHNTLINSVDDVRFYLEIYRHSGSSETHESKETHVN